MQRHGWLCISEMSSFSLLGQVSSPWLVSLGLIVPQSPEAGLALTLLQSSGLCLLTAGILGAECHDCSEIITIKEKRIERSTTVRTTQGKLKCFRSLLLQGSDVLQEKNKKQNK